jgi:1,4-dihydroxy-2-naphthoyl-CoA hydrolase
MSVGQEINANHLRSVKSGLVTGVTRPFHIGKRTQVWGIEITDELGRLTCVARITMAIVERTRS